MKVTTGHLYLIHLLHLNCFNENCMQRIAIIDLTSTIYGWEKVVIGERGYQCFNKGFTDWGSSFRTGLGTWGPCWRFLLAWVEDRCFI